MITSALAVALFAAVPEPPRVQALADGRFRISVARRGLDSSLFIRAILDIRAEAARRCQGRGEPVEIGQGEIIAMPGERWELVSTYACGTPAPATAPPPEGA